MELILNCNQVRFLAALLELHRKDDSRQVKRLVEKVDKLMEEVCENDRHLEAIKQAIYRGEKPPFELVNEDGCLTAKSIKTLSPAEQKHANLITILHSLAKLEPQLKNGWRSLIRKDTDGKVLFRLWKEPCELKDQNSLQFFFDPATTDGYTAMCEINHSVPLEAF